MKRSIVGIVLGAAILAASSFAATTASADEPDGAAVEAGKSKRGEITLPPTVITGNFMRPQVAVMITRIKADLALVLLKQEFLERIAESVMKGPF